MEEVINKWLLEYKPIKEIAEMIHTEVEWRLYH